MSNTTNFSSLKDKYNGFYKPVIYLSVISKSNRDKFIVTDLNIELTSEFSANIAMVNIYNVFDNDERKFKDDDFKQTFQIGKKINIDIGYYKTTECVFCGFISGVTYEFSDKYIPYISLECLDVKAAMMANNNNAQITQGDYGSSIAEVIKKSVYRSYYKSSDVDSNIKSPDVEDKPLVELTNESDYDFIVRVAKKFGYEFFISQETLYFRKRKMKKEPIMSISHKDVIIDLEVNYNIVGMVNSVEIRSLNNKTGKVVVGTANANVKYSDSSYASKIVQNATKVIIDPSVNSESEAKDRAEVELDNLLWKFGTLKVRTIGIPEIIPGRFIQIKDLSDSINKKVYVTKVIHSINKDGFKTALEARVDSL